MTEISDRGIVSGRAGIFGQVEAQRLVDAAAQRPDWPKTGSGSISERQTLIGRGRGVRHQLLLRIGLVTVMLFAGAGMAGQVVQIIDDGSVEISALLTLGFAVFLIMAVFGQVRGLLSFVPSSGRLRRATTEPHKQASFSVTPHWLGQPSPSISVETTTSGRTMERTPRARWRRSLLSIVVVVMGGLAVAVLISGLIYDVVASGGVGFGHAISGGFTGLLSFGYAQFVRVLSQAGWRGAPLQLIRRAFYDSTRLFSGVNLTGQVAATGAATVIVAAAGLAPIVFENDPGFILVGSDPNGRVMYLVEPTDGALSVVTTAGAFSLITPLAAVPRAFQFPGLGETPPKTVLGIIRNGPNARVVAVQVIRGRIEVVTELRRPPVDVVGIGLQRNGRLLVLQRDGSVWRADFQSGSWLRGGSIGREIEAAGYILENETFIAVSKGTLFIIDPTTRETSELGFIEELREAKPCGIAVVGNKIAVADQATQSIIGIDAKRLVTLGTIGPSPFPTSVCNLVAVG